MTARDELERRLAGWLGETGHVRAPDRVLDGALRRTMATGQLPGLPGLGRLVGPTASPFAQVGMALAATAVVAVVAIVGLTALAGRPPQPPSVGAGNTVRWQTEVVSLDAADFFIEAGGVRYVDAPGAMRVRSDPGDLTYWTLEVEWREHDRVMRLNLYFAADGRDWWVSEIRTYDGRDPADWIYYKGVFFKRPLGQAFAGDVDLSSSLPFPGRLVFRGLQLAVHPQPSFVAPPGGGIELSSDPFEPGGPLHCSGILQLTPQDAEAVLSGLGYRLSWLYEYSTGPESGYGERRLSPPDGVITGSAIGTFGELIVFVSPPDDPGTKAATLPPACPPPSP